MSRVRGCLCSEREFTGVVFEFFIKVVRRSFEGRVLDLQWDLRSRGRRSKAVY